MRHRGNVDEARVVFTKNNDQMAFIKLTDMSGTIETVAFPKIFKEFKTYSSKISVLS